MTLRLREIEVDELNDERLQGFSALLQSMHSQSMYIAIDEDGDPDELVGSVLDCQYRLERLVRRDNHAIVYAVKDLNMPQARLEARAYTLSGLSKKLLQSRKRNMKRLAKRVAHEIQYEGRIFLVYQPDQLGAANEDARNTSQMIKKEEDSKSATSLSASGWMSPPFSSLMDPPVSDHLESDESTAKRPKKTEHRKQVAGIKQRARRARRRKESKVSLVETDLAIEGPKHSNGREKGRKKPTPHERSMEFLLTLYRLNKTDDSVISSTEHKPDMLGKDERGAPDLLNKYLSNGFVNEMSFEDVGSLQTVVTALKEDFLFLEKQERNLPRLLQKKTLECSRLAQQLAVLDESSWEWEERKEEISSMSNQLLILNQVKVMLTDIRKVAHRCHEQLAKRLSLVLQLLSEHNKLYRLTRLGTDSLEDLQQRKSSLLPFSPSYNKLESQIKAIQRDPGLQSVGELEVARGRAWSDYRRALGHSE